jgi:ABC-type lipoprotein export system ATPase subunit
VKIISADERLAERNGPKVLITGPSGIGKTTLLHTLAPELLANALFIDIEAGDIAVAT